MNHKCKTSFTSKTSKYYSYGDVISEQEYNSLPPNEGNNFSTRVSIEEDSRFDEFPKVKK